MKKFKALLNTMLLAAFCFLLTSCDSSNMSVYGSVSVSSGYSSYHNPYYNPHYRAGYRGYPSPRMRGSMTVGGRIR